MKAQRFCLTVTALLALASQSVPAQMPGSRQPRVNPAMTKLFGEVTGFTSKAEMRLKDKAGKETMNMNMDFAFLDGKVRTEIDLTQMKSKDMPAEATGMMKQMGMDKMVNIVRPDRKAMLLVYPGLRGYVENPLPASETAMAESKVKLEKEKLGKETIDGHPCEKCKVTMIDDKGEKREAVVWQASDLKDFPVQMEMAEGDTSMSILYRDLKIAKPDAQLFEAPADFTKHENMQGLMQGAMMRMMGGNK